MCSGGGGGEYSGGPEASGGAPAAPTTAAMAPPPVPGADASKPTLETPTDSETQDFKGADTKGRRRVRRKPFSQNGPTGSTDLGGSGSGTQTSGGAGIRM